MRHLNHLPIWRDANRLLLAIEQAVRQFPRDHKYTLGTDLRRQAMRVCQLILRAVNKGDDQLARVSWVVDAVDDLKLQIQLGKALQLFQGLGQSLRRAGRSYCFVAEAGHLPGGMKRRVMRDLFVGPDARLTHNRSGAACPSPLVH
ncbi:MAG: four helix bundle protein [Sphingobacteriia bacterium]|nr:four helix bundle protein [Sphingobacteriia bacterium]NCC40602.1 four helix bundle protein [Gammaproteobacteria bacterium]